MKHGAKMPSSTQNQTGKFHMYVYIVYAQLLFVHIYIYTSTNAFMYIYVIFIHMCGVVAKRLASSTN